MNKRMSLFKCSFCRGDDDIGGVLKCGGCKRSYCHNCWSTVFIHEHCRNCIYCAHKRIYIECSRCNKTIDVINIFKRCYKCHRHLCEECQYSENHGSGICW